MATRDELEDRVWDLAKEYSYDSKYTADLVKMLANKEWMAQEPAFEHHKTREDIIETDIWKNVALALSGRVLDYIETGSWGANRDNPKETGFPASDLLNRIRTDISNRVLQKLRQEFPEAAATVAAQNGEGEIAAQISPKNTISPSSSGPTNS